MHILEDLVSEYSNHHKAVKSEFVERRQRLQYGFNTLIPFERLDMGCAVCG